MIQWGECFASSERWISCLFFSYHGCTLNLYVTANLNHFFLGSCSGTHFSFPFCGETYVFYACGWTIPSRLSYICFKADFTCTSSQDNLFYISGFSTIEWQESTCTKRDMHKCMYWEVPLQTSLHTNKALWEWVLALCIRLLWVILQVSQGQKEENVSEVTGQECSLSTRLLVSLYATKLQCTG